MRFLILGLATSLFASGLAAGKSPPGRAALAATCDSGATWSVTPNGDVLEIGYGCGTSFPQVAAVHVDSCYVRLVPSSDSTFATSVIACPSYWGIEPGLLGWTRLPPPAADLREIVAAPGIVVVGAGSAIFRSIDGGATWDTPPYDNGSAFDLEIDSGVLYVAQRGCYEASDDFGETWRGLIGQCPCGRDNCRAIDFENGVGWVVGDSWGFSSGPSRRSGQSGWQLRRGDLPFPDVNLIALVVDPVDPENVAYVKSLYGGPYVTRDGGEHWVPIPETVLFATPDGAYTATQFSSDGGATWQPHGMGCARAFASGDDGELFAAACDGGVRRRAPDGSWHRTGLEGEIAVSLAVSSGSLYAVLADGGVARASLEPLGGEVYYQGTPITTTPKLKGRRLVLRFSGVIGELPFAGKLVLNPPRKGALTVRVSARTSAQPDLSPRPGEAFKPVMLSSMRISPTIWDSSLVVLSTRLLPIPESGFVFPDEAPSSATFGLIGGSSDWKLRAPTIMVQSDVARLVQGHIVPSQDPNDDNLGLWGASDSVLESWRYKIRVLRED